MSDRFLSDEEDAKNYRQLLAEAIYCEDPREFVMILIEKAVDRGYSPDGRGLSLLGKRAMEREL